MAKLLVETGYQVVGLDNINDYYDQNLKLARLKDLGIDTDEIEYNSILIGKGVSFIKLDLIDLENLKAYAAEELRNEKTLKKLESFDQD